MKVGQIKRAKESFSPLFLKGDEFKIVQLNDDYNLKPIEAVKIKSGEIYGFEEGELI